MRSKRSLANSCRLLAVALVGLTTPGSAFADYAYVTNQSSSDLSVIDLDRMVEVGRISVPGQPAGIAVAPELGAVFTVSPDSKMLRRYGIPAGAPAAERRLDGGPIGVAVDERRGRVFVSDWYNSRVFVIAADSLATLNVLSTGSAPAGLALSHDGQWLATADRDANQVSIFDAETLTLRHRVAVGSRPFGVTFSPDGRVFSADVGSNTVTAVDPVSGRVLGHAATRERPYAVAFASGRGFVTNQYDDSVSVFDAQSLAAGRGHRYRRISGRHRHISGWPTDRRGELVFKQPHGDRLRKLGDYRRDRNRRRAACFRTLSGAGARSRRGACFPAVIISLPTRFRVEALDGITGRCPAIGPLWIPEDTGVAIFHGALGGIPGHSAATDAEEQHRPILVAARGLFQPGTKVALHDIRQAAIADIRQPQSGRDG
ncbi:YVTN family beta-propeller protein [Sinorhizobium fredii]